MSTLPDWIARIDETVLSQGPLVEALSIAWQALELATRPEGRYSMDHYQHAKNTIEDSINSAKDAMRRIEAIGKCAVNHSFDKRCEGCDQ